jgi:hypothetical protein
MARPAMVTGTNMTKRASRMKPTAVPPLTPTALSPSTSPASNVPA